MVCALSVLCFVYPLSLSRPLLSGGKKEKKKPRSSSFFFSWENKIRGKSRTLSGFFYFDKRGTLAQSGEKSEERLAFLFLGNENQDYKTSAEKKRGKIRNVTGLSTGIFPR